MLRKTKKRLKALRDTSLMLAMFFLPFGYDFLFKLIMEVSGSFWVADLIFYGISIIFKPKCKFVFILDILRDVKSFYLFLSGCLHLLWTPIPTERRPPSPLNKLFKEFVFNSLILITVLLTKILEKPC
jgi:hypothetical protein